MEEIKTLVEIALPLSCSNALEAVLQRLEEIGVEEIDDLQLLDFNTDFNGIIKDIPARKFKLNISKYFRGNEETEQNSLAGLSTSSVILPPVKSLTPPNAQKYWAENVIVSNDWLSNTVRTKLEKGRRPHPSEYREMVRNIVMKLMDVCEKPPRNELAFVAEKIVTKYPVLKDEIYGNLIGSGYDSLLKKLISRVDNVYHSKMGKKVRTAAQERRSCKKLLVDIEDASSVEQENLKKRLLDLYMQLDKWSHAEIKDLMRQSFPLQRKLILEEKLSIEELKVEFPFLFTSKYMSQYFEILLDLDLAKIKERQENKIKELIRFFKHEKIFKKDAESENYLAALVRYLEERIDQIIRIYEEDDTVFDILKEENIPVSPFIAVFGDPYKKEENCILVIDKQSASEYLCLKSIIPLWFYSFYVFDLMYPEDCTATAEFMQRVFYNINPEKGRKSKKRRGIVPVNWKVSKLVEALCNFETNIRK